MNLPIRSARFLLPKSGISLEKWAVIACDQHTSDLSYWESLAAYVGAEPSTLNLIFPEVYLEKGGEVERTQRIIDTMNEYLTRGIFCEYEGMVSITRQVSNGKTRNGILLCVDLEHYSFEKGAKPLIRASEGTVLERIPPRVAVRNRCSLELPHIMLLYDDPDYLVQTAVGTTAGNTLYDFDLSMGGGHIRGVHMQDCSAILSAFQKLLSGSCARTGENIMFAVGDGNHSLAAAKQVYEDAKKTGCGEQCRYALCEAVNLYDEALEFEPIHRLVFAPDVAASCAEIAENMPADPIEAIAFVDEYARARGYETDYIHGIEHLEKLANQLSAAAIALQPIEKAGFFPYVVKNGSLPKKTFSMGEAQDKRYYLEAAKIK